MRSRVHIPWRGLVMIGCVALTAGCESAGPGGGGSSGTNEQGAEKSQYSRAELSSLTGDYMPPLQNGSLEVASPQGWTWGRAGSKYLVGFHQDGSSLNNLPRILISATATPFPEIDDVNAENVADFGKVIATEIAGEEVATPARPILLADTAWVRYVVRGRKGNAWVSQLHIKTQRGGQLYTVRLEVYERQYSKFRDAGYAVAASMRFSNDAVTGPPPEENAEGATPPEEGVGDAPPPGDGDES